jgi:hypothetical protein
MLKVMLHCGVLIYALLLHQLLFHTLLLYALLLHDHHSFIFCSMYAVPGFCSLLEVSLVYSSPPCPHSSLLYA